MSDVVRAVVGVVLIVVGALTSWAGGEFLIQVGASLLLSAAADALGPKPPRAPPLSGIDIAYSGTLEPRRLLYGQLKISGMNVLPPLTSGANNDYFHQILCLAGRPITSIGDVYFGQIRIPSANIGAVTGTANDGLVSGIPAPPAGTVNGHGYNNLAWIRRYDGTQSTVDFILNSQFTAWDSNHKGQDDPYLALQFKFDQNAYSSGVPQVTAIPQGHKLYDPRQDSTNGGSGSQRYATPSTWTYGTCPALVLRDYLTCSLGLSEAQTRIDDALVIAAANICDQAVTVPIPVLVGLTNWTNGSAIVTGNNTAFAAALVANGYVKAPNGSMLQVLSIQSDVQFTLIATYGGATASGQVTQYNNASTATTVTQNRYTCNTALDATARFEDNIATLAGAMMGHCLYSGGKWRMYAGAWSGSAFTLTEDDLTGGVTIQCTTPRKDLYNAVRGNFIDPQQNYQPSEFPPIINATYAAQDGETIYVETNFPCCSDRYEAQRNAILINRQSRNRRVVTAQYGMSAYGVKVYETGTVTISEVGWINQTVRCVSWKFQPQGIVELTLQEAYAADWTDPVAGTDYAIVGINVGPTAGSYLPYPPTALTTTSVPGRIQFNLTLPSQVLPGTVIELWEYTANTPFSSATLVWFGTATSLVLNKNDIVTRYYWARTRGPNNQVSATYPATTGVAGVALSPSNAEWTPWIATGNCVVSDTSAMKQGGSAAFDSSIYSLLGYQTCHISSKPNAPSITQRYWMGFATNPTAGPALSTLDYSIGIVNNGSGVCIYQVYESGSNIGTVGSTPSASDILTITYDGATVTYYVNGVSVHTTAAVGLTLYGMVIMYDPSVGLNTLRIGPTTNLKVNSTGELEGNAATATASSSVAGPITLGNQTFGSSTWDQVASVTVGPYPYDTNVVLTANCEWDFACSATGAGHAADAGIGSTTTSVANRITIMLVTNGQAVNGTTYSGTATIENIFSLLANTTQTYYFNAHGWTSPSAQTISLQNIFFKAEVIKR